MAAYLKLVLSESEINVANNTSLVTAKLYYYGNGQSYNYNNPKGTITIDGTAYSFNHDFTKSSSAQLLATKSKTVTHGSDGKKEIVVSASFKTGVSLGTMSTSKSLELAQIPRASDLTLNKTTVPADGITEVIATATKKHSDFTDVLTVTLGDYNETIESGIAFTIPKEWIEAIPTTSAKATVKVTTKSGETIIGTNTAELTVSVPDEIIPSIKSVYIEDAIESIAAAFGGLYIKGKSQLNVVIDAEGIYGSSISSYAATLDGVKYIQQAFTSNVINTAGELIMQVSVSDTRGRGNSVDIPISVVDYGQPTVTSMNYYHCNEDGTRNSSGTCTKVIIGYKLYPVENKDGEPQNTKAMKLSYKAMSEELYTERTINLPDWEGVVEVIIANTDSSVTYEYIAQLTDKLGSSAPARITTGVVAMSRRAGGTGITVGGEAELPGFIVANGWDATFTGDIYLEVDEEFEELYASVIGVGG